MAKCPSNLEGWDNLVKIMGNNRILAFQAVYENGGKIPLPTSPIIKKIKEFELVTSPEVIEEVDNEGNSTGYYVTSDLVSRFKRTTDYAVGFIKEFNPLNKNKKGTDKKVTYAEQEAEYKYKGLDEKETLANQYSGEQETKEEYLHSIKKMQEHGRVKGLLIHKAIERILNPEQSLKISKEIDELLANYEYEYGDSKAINWKWVETKNKEGEYETLTNMLEAVGVNTLSKIKDTKENEQLRDEILSEVRVTNEDLGYGGTIDMLVKKPNGKYSIIDWKTGRRFNPTENSIGNILLKYGNQGSREVLDSPINRAKLQIMFYAVMLKSNNPGIEFEKLAVSWIPTVFDSAERDANQNIDVKAFLKMIEDMLGDENALNEMGMPKDVKAKLLAKDSNIFNPSHYVESMSEDLAGEILESGDTPNLLMSKKIQKLNALVGKGYAMSKSETHKAELRTLTAEERKEVIKLTKDILSMQAEGAIDLFGETGESMGVFATWLGNFNDVNNPMVQEWKRYYDKQQTKIRNERIQLENKFQSLLTPLINKENRLAAGFRGNRNYNYERLYGKFFVKDKSDGTANERFVHNEETDPELKAIYDNLSTDEKLFIDFVNDTFSKFFDKDAYINKQAYTVEGVSKSHIGVYNMNKEKVDQFNYNKGFFFKVPITNLELKNRFGVGKAIRSYFKINLTYFVEDNMEQEMGNQQFVPIKYLGNKYVNNSQLYTKNIHHIFTGGLKSMLEKEHLDSVYSMGAGISSLLTDETSIDIDKYKNLKKFVDLRLFGQVQGRKKRLSVSRRGMKITKIVGKNKGKHTYIAPEKVMKMLQSLASMSIMWLKPLQGIGNGMHAMLLTHRDGLKGTLTSKIDGFDTDSIDFTSSDIARADGEYRKLIEDTAMGTIRQNKMLLLARKFNYFGNNYDYVTMDKFTMSENFKYVDKSLAYMFHSIPEEFVSLTTMTAQMMHAKNKETGKSIWESYKPVEVGPGIWDLEWVGGVRGTVKTGDGPTAQYTELTELTAQEQAKLRRVHERLQGGYRKDEATNAEIYALGSMMLQFKKYLPRLILNLGHSKMNSTDLGYYKQLFNDEGKPVYEDRNGKEIPVMEWHARVEEGRLKSLTNALLKVANIKTDKLTNIEKENGVEAMATMAFAGIMIGLYSLIFADADDDDTMKKWWRMYLIDNLSQQYNPQDLWKTISTAGSPVAITQAYKTSVSAVEMIVARTNYAIGNNDAAFTRKGDLRGWNQFKKGVPIISSVTDMIGKIDKADPDNWTFSLWSDANSDIRLK